MLIAKIKKKSNEVHLPDGLLRGIHGDKVPLIGSQSNFIYFNKLCDPILLYYGAVCKITQGVARKDYK